ncbi:pyocin knob domain-containing protein [Paenibacillus hodogayensis]|uniref:Pyocin knob domain-containing protein n=1 Tax=Paenibacillus hodogayensis TaxID=279208 RepID=A0ABV5W0Z9_9BACL
MPETTPKLGLKKPLGNETVSLEAHNENLDLIDRNVAAQTEFDAHRTAPVLDHPDGSVTDTKIGSRTISDDAAPTGNTALPTTLWSGLGYMIKSITGGSSWRDLPGMTIAAIKTILDAATNLATGSTLVKRDANGRFKAAAPSAADDVARKAEVDAVSVTATNAVPKTRFINDGTDFNTVVDSGFYRFGTGHPNRPAAVDFGQLLVIHGGGDTIIQLAAGVNDSRFYMRHGNPPNVGGNGAWTPWVELFNSTAGGTLINDAAISGKTTSGVAKKLLAMGTDNVVYVGDTAHYLRLRSSYTPLYNNGAGEYELIHSGGGQNIYGSLGINSPGFANNGQGLVMGTWQSNLALFEVNHDGTTNAVSGFLFQRYGGGQLAVISETGFTYKGSDVMRSNSAYLNNATGLGAKENNGTTRHVVSMGPDNVLYFGNGANTLNLDGPSVRVRGNEIIHAGGGAMHGSLSLTAGAALYAPPTSGSIAANTSGAAALEVRSNGAAGDAAFMTFHRSGQFAAHFGLDTDNYLRIGGWSTGANSYKVWDERSMRVNNGVLEVTTDGGATWFSTNPASLSYSELRGPGGDAGVSNASWATLVNLSMRGRLEYASFSARGLEDDESGSFTIRYRVIVDDNIVWQPDIYCDTHTGSSLTYLNNDILYFKRNFKIEAIVVQNGTGRPSRTAGYGLRYRQAV